MYAGHYTSAERDYEAAIADAPRDPHAMASYALFLNYTGRGDAAQAVVSRAAASDPPDGYAFAIACRVNDWAGNFAEAISAGRHAVQLAPSEPLAHLFFAEALADTGSLGESEGQIAAATTLAAAHSTPYLNAEVAREQGNLAGDRGDLAGREAAFKRAAEAQPGWVYRSVEYADSVFGAGDSGEAQQLLLSAAGSVSDDSLALASVGEEAISIGDASLAGTVWARALAVSPNDPTVLDQAGEVQVAANDDVNAAIRDFEAALRSDPSDAEAAGYLLALARYVQRDASLGAAEIARAVAASETRHGTGIASPDPDALLEADAQRALDDVNAVRASAGLPPVRRDAHLDASARSHSYYWFFNNLSTTVTGLGIHQETAGLPGYSGQFPWTRAVHFGYPNQRIGEDIDHRGDPVKAVDEWVDSVFHRFAILRPDLVAIGYGEARLGPELEIEDMEFGFTGAAAGAPAAYPGAGTTNVTAIFVDNELPDPVPPGKPRTTGTPVTVTFPEVDSVNVSTFTLTDSQGHVLATYSGAPSAETENSAWILPVQPLAAASTYTAHIVATVNGSAYDRSWSFTTAA